MSPSHSEPVLLDLLDHALQTHACLTVVLTPHEADAQRTQAALQALGAAVLGEDDVALMPGFVQTGVFRFESARKVIAKRLGTLHRLRNALPRVLVCSVAGFARTAPTLGWLEECTRTVALGDEVELDALIKALEEKNYTLVQRVEEVGEFCVRGAILDVWTPGQRTPSRIEFFGDAVEKIRSFRASDQRSFATLDSLSLLPAREFSWPAESDKQSALERFNAAILAQGTPGAVRADLLENLRHAVPFVGIDDVSGAFSPTPVVPFHALLSEHARARGCEVKVVCHGRAEALSKAVEELESLYDTAFSVGYGKAHLNAKFDALFPNGRLLRSRLASAVDASASRTSVEPVDAGTGAPETKAGPIPSSAAHPLPELSPFAPDAALSLPTPEVRAVMENVSRQKFAARVQALARLLEREVIGGLMFLCHSKDTFLELSGVLAKYFPALGDLAPSLEIPPFDVRDVRRASTGAASLGGRLFAARAALDEAFFLPRAGILAVSETWLQGIAREDGIETYSDSSSGGAGGSGRAGDAQSAVPSAAESFFSAQFGDFAEGDLVVHVQHGIARFKGLMTIKVMDITGDFLVLEYAGHDKVYVPVHKLNQVQKYIGRDRDDDSALDSLKSGQWEKRRVRAKAEAEKLARDLMEHQAKRAMAPGHAFARIDEEYVAFEAAFPYDETPDQVRAVREIMADMGKPKAMDRLLCGDVGFGKTEVAMRAAFRCVMDGKQVSWLVPTTVLAHQHYRSLKERFAGFGVDVEIMDRSVGAASTRMLERLKKGEIDIVVGTHRLLSKDIAFRDLGVLIVDEEQRFGVLQKEKIKAMSYGVDVLTMTATPIPRTLQMAMIGLRDLSLLTTPPKARLAVKTFVCPYDEATLKDAISQELARGGQVFYVHNRVEELATIEAFLKQLVPQARIAVGHGKMSQKELDDTMIRFLEQRHDLLLCTTIIESGIDMPNVNTIIVQNADHFGLAQLYQLRGRVGRRSTRGYAYFVTSPGLRDEDEGAKRLEILREHQELGSGFLIASHDLEMRGAGNVLGDEQSGRVSDVGLETYTQMLDDAIKTLGGVKVRAMTEAEIQVPVSAQIPEGYIENARERLRVYRRFFGARSEEALRNLVSECEDRFGPIPEPVNLLAELARMRRWLLAIGALALTVGDDATEIRLGKEILQASNDEHAEQLVKRILDVCNRQARGVRLTPDGRVLYPLRKRAFLQDPSAAITDLKRFLSLIAGEAHA